MDVTARVDGLNETLRVLRRMDKEGQKELREAVQGVADKHAAAVRSAFSRDARWRHIAPTVRAKKDRMPVIMIGGARKAGVSGGATINDLLYGVEFGSNDWRFPPRTPRQGRGNAGYTIYPTLAARHRQVVDDWQRAVLEVARKWDD